MKELNQLLETSYDEETDLVRANIYQALGQTNQALKHFEYILHKNPKNAEACVQVAKIHKNESIDSALRQLKLCSKQIQDPEQASKINYIMGQIWLEKNDIQSSQKYFTNAYRIDPSNSQAALALGVIMEQMNQGDKAFSHYQKFLEQNPQDEIILTQMIDLSSRLGREKDHIHYFEQLVDFDDHNPELRMKLAYLYIDKEKWKKAEVLLEELLQGEPQADRARYLLSIVFAEQGLWDQVVKSAQKISRSSDVFERAAYLRVRAYHALDSQEGVSTEKGIAFNLELEKIYLDRLEFSVEVQTDIEYLYARHLDQKQEYARSIEVFLGMKKHNRMGIEHEYYLASVYDKIKDYKNFDKSILSILEKDPNHYNALNYIGYSYLTRKINFDQAYKYIKKAVELSPKDGYIRDSLGWYYYLTGNYQKAQIELEVAVKLQADDPIILGHLGQVYESRGLFGEASGFYRKALKVATLEKDKQDLQGYLQRVEKLRSPAAASND